MTEKAYEEYAILDAKIKTLTDQRDAIRMEILENLVAQDLQSLNTAVGKFTISKLKSWTYTPAVEEKNEELKALKASEESTGEATYEEKPSLRFIQVKF